MVIMSESEKPSEAASESAPEPASESAPELTPESTPESVPVIPKRSFKQAVKDLLTAVQSPDPGTRTAGRWWWVLVSVLVAVSIVGGRRSWKARQEKKAEQARLLAAVKLVDPKEMKLREEERAKRMISLGEFSLELRPREETAEIASNPDLKGRAYKDHMNLATLEIVVECETVAACELLSAQIVQVRDQLVLMFSGLERDVLMSKDGKAKLKAAIQERLNTWLDQHQEKVGDQPGGKVEAVHFTQLIMT